MRDLDLIFFFHLYGDYVMTDKEKLLSEVRKDTYKLYQEKAEELRYLKQKIGDLC